MVARNFRSPRRRGEIDLIGWEGDVLCFVEVKTRTSRDVKPAHVAVDREKLRELIAMAHEYLHRLRTQPLWRIASSACISRNLRALRTSNCSKTHSQSHKR